MHQWFISYNGQQMGPLDHATAVAQATKNPNGHVWRQGFAEWIPLSACTELSAGSGTALNAPPPPTSRRADEIDYRIYGEDMQFVEIELDPGRERRGRSRAMMYKEARCRWTPCSATVPVRPGRRLHGQAARRRQARDHRREPLHHDVHARAAAARPRSRSPRPTPAP
jgi:hypothetical protein